MPDIDESVISAWMEVFKLMQLGTPYRHAMLGDGNGNVDVNGKVGWSWVRYGEDQSKLSQVRNFFWGQIPDGTPVIVGKLHPGEDHERVLYVDFWTYGQNLTQTNLTQYVTGPHGESHYGLDGSDPAPIDYANLIPGKIHPTDPETMNIYVEAFYYPYGMTLHTWDGGSLDLTAHVPAVAGHRYVLVYMDMDDETLAAVAGDIVPNAVPPDIPSVPEYAIPLGVVEMYFGQTVVDSGYWQYKILWGSLGQLAAPHTHSDDSSGGDSIVGLGELTFDCHEALYIFGGNIWPTNVYHSLYALDPGLYISGNVITVDLDWIHPDPVWGCGQLLIVRPGVNGLYTDYVIRVKHGTGNIRLSNEQHIFLESPQDHLMLIYDGTYWCDVQGVQPFLESEIVRIGRVTSYNEGVAGYGSYLYFSGGPSFGVLDSDNSDPLWMARYNVSNDLTELRLNIGDDPAGSPPEKFVVGCTQAGAWDPSLSVNIGSPTQAHYGVRTITSDRNVASPPTDADLDAAFGQPADLGDGFLGVLDDNGAGTDVYLCVVKNSLWWYEQLTQAL